MKLTIKTLYVSLVVLNVLDMAVTKVGLPYEGFVETNPITLWSWERFGVEQTALIRIIFLIVFGVVSAVALKIAVGRDAEIARSVIWITLFCVTLFYLVIVTESIETLVRILGQ